jgi:AraC family transcriptional regulator of adaptative response / DNA-3-methyladenine glycosylase II
MLEDTDLSITEIAFAAGFGSARQFNRTFLEVFRARPGELRLRRRRSDLLAADGGLVMRLAFRPPLDWFGMIGYFQARAIPGVESVQGTVYRRTILVDGDPGVLEIWRGGTDHLLLRLHLPHWEGLIHLVQQSRRIFNLDIDLESATNHLLADPALRAVVATKAGIRPPGTWDPFEVGVTAILGEGLTATPSRSAIGRLVRDYGARVPGLDAMGLTHLFPKAEDLAGADLRRLDLDGSTELTLRAFVRAWDDGSIRLDGASTLDKLVADLTALPGLSDDAASYVAMRMGEGDALPWNDPGIRARLECQLGTPMSQYQFHQMTETWRPWRAQAAAFLALEETGCPRQSV